MRYIGFNSYIVDVTRLRETLMQDRYAGDIGDFGKFGLLRALASEGLSIGINWYRFGTPARELAVNDGMKLIPDELASCDQVLADTLRAISTSPSRSIKALEATVLVPGARYYSSTVPVEGRLEWHEKALSTLGDTGLVFLDPDNGLLVKSVGKRSAKSPKYAFYEEVTDYVARGQSVVVYNHRSRKKRAVYFNEIHDKLLAAVPKACGISAITFPKGSVRDYFAVSACPEHEDRIAAAFKNLFESKWGDSGMCRIQSLPYVDI